MSSRSGRARLVERFEFFPEDPALVLGWLEHLSSARSGWANFLPGVDDDGSAFAEPSGLFSIFSGARQPPVTMCTWVPPGGRPGPGDVVTVGVAHRQNRRVVPVLAEAGVVVPSTWQVAQDHVRRGLVLRVPITVPHLPVLSWLLDAGARLCLAPLTGSWQAEVHHPA
ncbi:MAG TPA: hypothetical protein VN781_05375 [Acidimicrobiales bacterium]|nr:hypothetical protein [Acidimicrobiales bacterium]